MEGNDRISLHSGGSVLKNPPANTKTWVLEIQNIWEFRVESDVKICVWILLFKKTDFLNLRKYPRGKESSEVISPSLA